MTPRVPEKVVQHHIVAALRAIGAAVYVLGHPSPRDGRSHRGTGQTPGVPDLLVLLPPRPCSVCAHPETCAIRHRGCLLFVEVKAEGGRLRPEQRDFRERCLAADVQHVTGNLDDVYAWLLAHHYLRASQVPHYRLPAEARA
jgi:hypothetical protein